jgi:hypothetical protein
LAWIISSSTRPTTSKSHVQIAPMWDRVFGIETILLAVAFVA